MNNREAVESTIETLEGLGRLEGVDVGLLMLCRTAASALDAFPERATLVKEYRECLVLLAEVGANDDHDAFAELLADLHSEVRDSPET